MASARATDRAIWVPEPRPEWAGIARCRCSRAPPLRPWWSRKRRAYNRTRSASSPVTMSSAAGLASSKSDGSCTAIPIPPKRRPRSPRRSSSPRCSRAGASTHTASPAVIPSSLQRRGFLAHVRGEHGHGLVLARTGGLVHDHLETLVLPHDLLDREDPRPRRQDGGFQHGVARAVEPEELALEPAVHHPALEAGTRRLDVGFLDLDLAPGADVREHDAAHLLRRDRG